MRTTMRALISLALATSLLAAPLAHAEPDDRLAQIEATIAKLQAEVAALKQKPSWRPSPRKIVALSAAPRALLYPVAAAFGSPILAYPGGGGSGGGGGVSDPYSGTMTATGYELTDSNVSITESGTDDLDLTADGSIGIRITNGVVQVLPNGTGYIEVGSTSVFIREAGTNDLEIGADGATRVTISDSTSSFSNDIITNKIRIRSGSQIEFGDTAGFTGLRFFDAGSTGGEAWDVTTLTIADSGGAGAATESSRPAGRIIEVTCSDADGCNWTFSETSVVGGQINTVCNVGTNTLNIVESAGVTNLSGAGNFAAGQDDCITVYYSTGRSSYIETNRSNN